jgi:hypothetical protein
VTTIQFLSYLRGALGPYKEGVDRANRLVGLTTGAVFLNIDPDEFATAALLRELINWPLLHEEILERGRRGFKNNSGVRPHDRILKEKGARLFAMEHLKQSAFTDDTKERIVTAVLECDKEDERSDSSELLATLRMVVKREREKLIGADI